MSPAVTEVGEADFDVQISAYVVTVIGAVAASLDGSLSGCGELTMPVRSKLPASISGSLARTSRPRVGADSPAASATPVSVHTRRPSDSSHAHGLPTAAVRSRPLSRLKRTVIGPGSVAGPLFLTVKASGLPGPPAMRAAELVVVSWRSALVSRVMTSLARLFTRSISRTSDVVVRTASTVLLSVSPAATDTLRTSGMSEVSTFQSEASGSRQVTVRGAAPEAGVHVQPEPE